MCKYTERTLTVNYLQSVRAHQAVGETDVSDSVYVFDFDSGTSDFMESPAGYTDSVKYGSLKSACIYML